MSNMTTDSKADIILFRLFPIISLLIFMIQEISSWYSLQIKFTVDMTLYVLNTSLLILFWSGKIYRRETSLTSIHFIYASGVFLMLCGGGGLFLGAMLLSFGVFVPYSFGVIIVIAMILGAIVALGGIALFVIRHPKRL